MVEKLKEFLAKYKERKNAETELDKQVRMEQRVADRQLSNNERELIRFRKEARERLIKKQVEAYRKMENRELWNGKMNNPLNAPNIMRDNGNIFTNQKKLFTGGQNILRQKNIFTK